MESPSARVSTNVHYSPSLLAMTSTAVVVGVALVVLGGLQLGGVRIPLLQPLYHRLPSSWIPVAIGATLLIGGTLSTLLIYRKRDANTSPDSEGVPKPTKAKDGLSLDELRAGIKNGTIQPESEVRLDLSCSEGEEPLTGLPEGVRDATTCTIVSLNLDGNRRIPLTDDDNTPLTWGMKLQSVSMRNCGLKGALGDHFLRSSSNSLTFLDLSENPDLDNNLKILLGFSQLQELRLAGCNLQDGCFEGAYLSVDALIRIDLSGNPALSCVPYPLRDLVGLETIVTEGTQITEPQLQRFFARLEFIKSLTVQRLKFDRAKYEEASDAKSRPQIDFFIVDPDKPQLERRDLPLIYTAAHLYHIAGETKFPEFFCRKVLDTPKIKKQLREAEKAFLDARDGASKANALTLVEAAIDTIKQAAATTEQHTSDYNPPLAVSWTTS